MAVLTSYGPLLGGYKSINPDRPWERGPRRAGVSEDHAVLPFGTRAPPLRKELPEDLLEDQRGPSTRLRDDAPVARATPPERPLRDSDAAFLLDFNAPFLRAVSKVESPSDVIFRERAVYWDLSPARAAYGKILYRQNSFFVNRKQDAGLGVNLNHFF